jgi:hypothetical protein
MGAYAPRACPEPLLVLLSYGVVDNYQCKRFNLPATNRFARTNAHFMESLVDRRSISYGILYTAALHHVSTMLERCVHLHN